MRVFRALTEKPWLATASDAGEKQRGPGSVPVEMTGLRFFLLVVTLLFTLLTSVYVMRMNFEDWQPLPEPGLLWVNTGLLVLSSVALQSARNGVRRDRIAAARKSLSLGGWLGVAFLAGQLLAWRQLAGMGYFAGTNPANAFFYLITALHGVHLIGGIVAWARTTARLRRGFALARMRKSVDLCTVYWHFLLLVWLVMFALLLVT